MSKKEKLKQSLTKEILYEKYITQNMRVTDIAKEYVTSRDTILRIIKDYGIVKPKSAAYELTKATMLEKYGYENAMQCKEVQQKARETSLRVYGTPCSLQNKEVILKTKATKLKKYGDENYLNWEKAAATCEKKYGVKNPMQSDIIKNKLKETNLSRFGYDYTLSSPEVQDKRKQTAIDRYGVSYICQTEKCQKTTRSKYSKPNEKINSKLLKLNLDYSREYIINNFSYDFKIGNILLEINPTYTHNIDVGYKGKGKPVSIDYHLNKSKAAWDNGFQCVHIWEWDDADHIISQIILDKTNISMERSESKIAVKYSDIYFLEFEKINDVFYTTSSLLFNTPLLNYLISNTDIISFYFECDNAKCSLFEFEKLGCKQIAEIKPQCIWAKTHGNKHQINTELSDDEMLKNKYVRVYDCGKTIWFWER